MEDALGENGLWPYVLPIDFRHSTERNTVCVIASNGAEITQTAMNRCQRRVEGIIGDVKLICWKVDSNSYIVGITNFPVI
jgi:UDP-N-acetylmuramoylalanine-D-glutamate ligase